MPTNNGKIVIIDILKALAILAVIGVHFTNAMPAPDADVSLTVGVIGAAAPQLFFIISAYLLFRSVRKYDFTSRSDTLRFYSSKARRILPLYFVILAVYCLAAPVPPRMTSILAHYLLVNSLSPYWINDITGVEWFVADLFLLFLITPLLARYIRDLKSAGRLMLVAMAASAVVQNSFMHYYGDMDADYSLHTYFNAFCFLIQLPGMLLGVVIYYLAELKGTGVRKKILLYVIFASVTAVIYKVSARFGAPLVSYRFITSLIWGLLLLAGILLERSYRNRIEKLSHHALWKGVTLLGTYSLGIYLVHILVIRYLVRYGDILLPDCSNLFYWFVSLLIVTVVSLAIAFVLETAVKKTKRPHRR